MSNPDEWMYKGATLTDATAQKEYGVSRDFLVQGIRTGHLEYRETSMWGNPSLRLLRSQVEQYISDKLGAEHLTAIKAETELRKINREIGSLKRKLTAALKRKVEVEAAIAAKASTVE